MGSWKGTANKYREALMTELERMGAPSFVISSNVPVNSRNVMTAGVEPRDVGVAVYFSRKLKEDFSWQDALGITDPYPTEDQIQDAFKRLAKQYHPDNALSGDLAMFQAVSRHRDNAIRWLKQKDKQAFDYVIANDQFKEVRLNMAAIVMSLRALRQLDRCGSTGLLERAFKGFTALEANAGADGVVR